jgi:HAE1 family hydrophobic/amphiphilic exporter-1
MLIGLSSKNAILIVEFAEQLREQGKAPLDAVVQAAATRLRPILMTSIAFLLGVLPLMLASGAGAAARNSLGTTVFGGALVSTIVNLVFIPGMYVLVQRFRKAKHRGGVPMPAEAGAHAGE